MSFAARRAVNLSLDANLVAEARALDINISRACQRGLADAVAEQRRAQWQVENVEAIEASNDYAEKHGLPLADLRLF